ncbi:unnamed protein product, partial [marine sediment metagenome]
NSETEKTETINEVDVTKSVCYLLGIEPYSGTIDNTFSRVSLVNATTVKAERCATNGMPFPHTLLCVLEFSSGIASVQQGVADIVGSPMFVDVTIDAVDIAKALLFYGGWSYGTDTVLTQVSAFIPRIELSNSETVRASRGSNSTTKHTYVGFTVLEFE